MKFLLLFLSYCFLAGPAQGFVLVSNQKARLPATPLSPVVFLWNGSFPSLEDKEKFEDGQYATQSDKEFMQTLLTIALSRWSTVTGSYLKLEMQESTNAKVDAEDKVFSIVVEKTDNLSIAAAAKPIPNKESGLIEDCDINIADRSSDASYLAYTIVHELGHCIGLGHPHTNYNSIMGYSRMDHDTTLGADDKAGVIYLYPDPKYGSGATKEALGCSLHPSSESGTPWSGRMLFAVLFLFLSPLLILQKSWLNARRR